MYVYDVSGCVCNVSFLLSLRKYTSTLYFGQFVITTFREPSSVETLISIYNT